MSLALLAAVVSAAFALIVGRRWLRTRRPAFAAWTFGLLIFSAAAGVQAAGEHGGFTVAQFRAFYLLGGVLGVIWLAQGTLFLSAPPRLARISAAVLGLLTVLLAVDALAVGVNPARLGDPAGILGDALTQTTSPLRLAAIVFNIAGTLILVGGSGWSAWRFWRGRAPLDRVVCNVLLTAGALMIAAGFSAAKVTGAAISTLDVLGGYEAAGITVMFAGFLSLGRLNRLPGRTRYPAAAQRDGSGGGGR